MTDGRCRFGPRAKREMVARLLAGEKARAIARDMGCSPTTVCTTRDRWQAASDDERASGAWCAPRRPVLRSCRWALTSEEEQAILDAREKSNWGDMRLTWLTGRHRSTIGKVLRRHGKSRRRRSAPRQTSRRYEWTEAGALLHIDAFEVPSSPSRPIGRPAGAPSTTGHARPARPSSSGSSTITAAWPTASCTAPRTPRRSRRPCGALSRGCASRAAARRRRS